MPCRSEYDDEPKVSIKERERADLVTKHLCTTLTMLEYIYEGKLPRDLMREHPEVLAWWENHKECDRKRREEREKDFSYEQKLKAWEAQKPKR